MWRRAVFVLWWAMCSLGVQAQQVVEGVRFERDTVVQGQSLVLNGAGLRAMMIIKVYAAGLYLPQVAKTAPQALSAAGAKRVRIVMLRNVSAQRLAGNLLSGVQETTPTTAETQALAPRLDWSKAFLGNIGELPGFTMGPSVDLHAAGTVALNAAGQVDAAVEILGPLKPQISAKAVRLLGVMGACRRKDQPLVPVVRVLPGAMCAVVCACICSQPGSRLQR